jgi:protein-S-isoprenylcysteine O-methyltransferase Ste14
MTLFKFSKDELKNRLNYFLWDVVLIWSCLLFYSTHSYYTGLLSNFEQQTFFWMGIAFTLLVWPLYLMKNAKPSHGFQLQKTLRLAVPRFFKVVSNSDKIFKEKWVNFTEDEQVNALFLLVKIFFTPLLLHFAFANYESLIGTFTAFQNDQNPVDFQVYFNVILFPLILSFLLLIDTICFLLGYLTESDFLGNRIRSVDSTWLGWLVALMCYPPFNDVSGQYFPGGGGDYIIFWDNNLTFWFRILILLLYAVYTSASLALGFKASNLTNRGIVTTGPYSLVRHPAYVSKNLVWLLTVLPLGSLPALLSVLGFMFIYFLRSVTEERHLIQDPDYQAYCQKVKYRFIPGLY